MRSVSLAFLLFSLVSSTACCGKKENPTPTSTTPTAAPTPTTTAKPCSGMASTKDCQACCNPAFHPGWRFTNGKCDCGVKLPQLARGEWGYLPPVVSGFLLLFQPLDGLGQQR